MTDLVMTGHGHSVDHTRLACIRDQTFIDYLSGGLLLSDGLGRFKGEK